VHDALASAEAAEREYGIALSDMGEFRQLDGLVLAVPHRDYLDPVRTDVTGALAPGGIFIDVKGALSPADVPGATYWSL
jgi:UDP-N-acetyl-D-glucosamine/UDP-N-acetyl-D-galactosamine dehydrogenase